MSYCSIMIGVHVMMMYKSRAMTCIIHISLSLIHKCESLLAGITAIIIVIITIIIILLHHHTIIITSIIIISSYSTIPSMTSV